MKALIAIGIFSLMACFLICQISQSDDEILLVFDEKIIDLGDVIYEVTGPKLSNENLVNIWLKTRAVDLEDPEGDFREFAKRKGLQIDFIKVDVDFEKRRFLISGKINQRYPHHFKEIYISYLNVRQIAAFREVSSQLQLMDKERRALFFETYPKRLSRIAIDWNELIQN